MYLKTLTIKGFKSFAHPTTFEFEPGVTAVVGPNGSGKSNVVDALAWVMGEQGAKTLRGGKMEDVIFAGTASKSPLGRAEVILTIDNSDGALPIEYAEVRISRILFRNGTSEYAINGETCRLLDVQELLSDSGLGREMHVIVGQGQLDAVLRATPEERRGFIEEAAGILKHRRRKERTQRKLEAMQTNFTRLNDLAGELRRQLKPLGAQADIAREAQQIQATVREAKSRLFAYDLAQLTAQIDELAAVDRRSRDDRSTIQQQITELLARQQLLEGQQVSDALDRARRVTFDLQRAEEKFRSLYNLTAQRVALLESAPTIPELDPALTRNRAEEALTQAAQFEAEAQTHVAEQESAALARQAAQNDLDALDRYVAEQNALVSKHDMRRAQLVAAVDVAASRVEALHSQERTQRRAVTDAETRSAQAAAALAAQETDPAAIADSTDAERVYRDASEAATVAAAELDEARAAHAEAVRARDTWAAKYSALAMAVANRDGSAGLLHAGLTGLAGTVADSITVEPGFEAAVAAALGSLADAVLADSADAAFAGLAHAEQAADGRVEIVLRGGPAPAPQPEVAGLVPLLSVVSAPDGVSRLLARSYLAADREGARAAFARLTAEMSVVTQTGELITPDVLRGGSDDGTSIVELLSQRDDAARQRDRAEGEVSEAESRLASAQAQAESTIAVQAEALAALRRHDAERAAASEQLNRARAAADAAVAELTRLSATAEAASADVAVAVGDHEGAVRALAEFDAEPAPILDAHDRATLVAALEVARQRELEARLTLETARERARSERQRAATLEHQAQQEKDALEAAARAAAVRRLQREQAVRIAAGLPEILDHIGRAVAEARDVERHEDALRAERHTELSELRAEIARLQQAQQSITDSVHGTELQLHEKRLNRATLLTRVEQELGLTEEILLDEYRPATATATATDLAGAGAEEPFDRDVERQRLAAAERKLGALGRVNPLALEEFAALEQRHTFLTEQLADLQATRADLETIITELDEKMQSIFTDAFADTKRAFHEVFPVLFPGGTGDIVLTNPDEPLATGIEVYIRPAGKKIDRLSLLSGGERSLAALALLVAIFKARPSPFYVMDEVEAALDDANLGRLLAVIEQLRVGSQLIIITHQKRTMEIADALYGVSMRQDGVSAVVGQRISHDDELEVAS